MDTSNEKSIRLGGSDLFVSRLGLGAMTWGDTSITPRFNPAQRVYGPADGKEELRNAIDSSLANGVNFLDTAAMYGKGSSELMVGELTQGKNMVIANKFPSGFISTSTGFPADLGNSIKRLKRIPIDLYQIHWPSKFFSIPRVINLMADAVHEGKIKAVGISNFSAKQMKEAYYLFAERGIPLASNQVEYSLLHREPEVNGILETCRELNVTLIAYMPLRMGALTGKYLGQSRPNGLRKRFSPFRNKDLPKLSRIISQLKEIGDRYSKSPAQVALRWLIQQGTILPIPGAKNAELAIHNAGALVFSLSNQEMEVLSQATLKFDYADKTDKYSSIEI